MGDGQGGDPCRGPSHRSIRGTLGAQPAPPPGAMLAAPDARTQWGCQLRTKDPRSDRRRAPPPGLNPPGALSPGGEGETVAPNLPKLGDPGRAWKKPHYLCGHKRQIHGVAAAAGARVLPAAAGPAARTAGREKATQRAGLPETPRRRRRPRQPGGGGRSRARAAPSAPSALTGWRAWSLRAGRGGAGLGVGRGQGAPSRDHSLPHPRGRGSVEPLTAGSRFPPRAGGRS